MSAKRKRPDAAKVQGDEEGADGDQPGTEGQAFLASAFKEAEIMWLWEKRIMYGGICFIDGDPGTGKSSLTVDIAARVAAGRKMPDGTLGGHGRVMFMVGEDNPATTVIPRFRAVRANPDRIAFYGSSPSGSIMERPRLPGCIDDLAQWVKRLKVTMLVIDPYMEFLATGLNPYSEQDVRIALGPLNQLCQSTGIAAVCIRHPTKNSSQKKIYRGGGSVGITAIARTVLWTAYHPDDDGIRLISVIKSNGSEFPPTLGYTIEAKGKSSAVNWLGDMDGIDDDPVTAAESKGRLGAFEEAKRLLTQALKTDARPAKDLLREAEEAGIGGRTLCAAKAAMRIESRRKKGTDGRPFWEWLLPRGKA